jgi:CheY-like chemotaxis protein
MKLRLTSRIVLFFVLLAAVLLATVGVLSYRSGSESLKAATISEMLATAVEKEATLNAWIEERLDDIGQIANQTDTRYASATDRLNMRVLVVDDNHTNRQILHNQVAAWKMQVGSAVSGDEALARLRAAVGQGQRYDVALLDVQMPKMDGLTLAAAIKSDPVLTGTGVDHAHLHGSRPQFRRIEATGDRGLSG